MQLALLFMLLAVAHHDPHSSIAEITASYDGRSLLVKRYQEDLGSPVRDYVLSHKTTAGERRSVPLGGFGNEDWEQDFLTSSGDLVFIAIGTQVGYHVPIVALVDRRKGNVLFVKGTEFSLEVGWWHEFGVAFYKRHVVFLCNVRDKKRIVVSDGSTLWSGLAPEGLLWIGGTGDCLLFLVERDGKSVYKSSRRLPTVVNDKVDLHLENLSNCLEVKKS